MSPVNSAEAKVLAVLRAAGFECACNVFIDNYEVDVVIDNWIIIEVDGFHHYARDTRGRDSAKERHLVEAGYHLIRIRNSDIHDQQKLQSLVEQVKLQLSSRRGAGIPMLTPFAQPKLQQLKEQLVAKEQARLTAQQQQRRTPPVAPKKNDRALFLEWLEREPVGDKEEQPGKRPGGKK